MPLSVINNSTQTTAWRLKKLYEDAKEAFDKKNWHKAASLLFYIHQQMPHFHRALFQLGVAQMSMHHWQGAEESFEKLRQDIPWDADIICNLAIIYWKQKKLKKALSYFRFNLKHYPHHLETANNLASLYIEYHHLHKAIQLYTQILYRKPKRFDIRFNLAACLQKKGWLDDAQSHYRHILQEHPTHFDSLYNLACVFWQQQNIDAARFYLKSALKIKNEPHLQFMLDTLVNQEANFSHHRDYVQHLFDNYADHYDEHLSKILGYQIPDYLSQYLSDKKFNHVVEVGCGTGLCGQVIRKVSRHLRGVDLSQEMLKKAKLKNTYDALDYQEAIDFLKRHPHSIDCLMVFDVSPYMSDFLKVFEFENIFEMMFTIEISEIYPKYLESSGRISYHPKAIEEASQKNQYQIFHQEKLGARIQHQQFVNLMFYHLKR